ncbi:MAG: single-stranded DNA-binding protein [Planctomycetota bacterium]
MNLNKAFLLGRLGKDPEMRYTPNGKAQTTFSLATNRYWKNDDGEKQEATDWHNIKCWGRQAEIANEFLRKGSLVLIEGRIENSSWQEEDGEWKNFSAVVANNIQLPPRSLSDDASSAPAGSSVSEPEDIPF